MSIWTHITGTIRVDDMKHMFSGKYADLSKIFIRDTWYHPDKNGNLPTGSEGSIDFEIINRQETEGSSYIRTVVFFGDLRGFEAQKCSSVIEWWKNLSVKLHEADCYVRQAVLEVSPEDGETIILTERDMVTPEEPLE